MKFLLLLLIFCLITTFQKSSDNLIFKRSLELDPPRPESLKKYPVVITIKIQELTICFLESVGSARITIVDESNQVVRQSVIDSMKQKIVVISMSTWKTGRYNIYIIHNTTTLHGKFVL